MSQFDPAVLRRLARALIDAPRPDALAVRRFARMAIEAADRLDDLGVTLDDYREEIAVLKEWIDAAAQEQAATRKPRRKAARPQAEGDAAPPTEPPTRRGPLSGRVGRVPDGTPAGPTEGGGSRIGATGAVQGDPGGQAEPAGNGPPEPTAPPFDFRPIIFDAVVISNGQRSGTFTSEAFALAVKRRFDLKVAHGEDWAAAVLRRLDYLIEMPTGSGGKATWRNQTG